MPPRRKPARKSTVQRKTTARRTSARATPRRSAKPKGVTGGVKAAIPGAPKAPGTGKNQVAATVGGQTYHVNTSTGVVRDSTGAIVIGATYDPKTGALTVSGQTTDVTPKRTPIAGQTYVRNFDNPQNWTTAVDPASGETYFVHKRNGNVFTTAGVYAGTYRGGRFEFFDVGTPGAPEEPGDIPDEERPDQPASELPPGWTWEYDDGTGTWIPVEGGAEEEFNEGLMAYVGDLLSQYGLDTPGLLGFARDAIAKGWDDNQIMRELRRHPDYLANPLFAANVERAKGGGGWISEAQVIQTANEANRLINQYGFGAASTTQLANMIRHGQSLSELEHKLQVRRNVIEWGPGTRAVMAELGYDLDDKDLQDLFDPEIDTQEWTDAFRSAAYRGRPFTLGLGVRDQAEADALQLLGIDIEAAQEGYRAMAGAVDPFKRLSSIEQLAIGNLPTDFGAELAAKADNGLLFRAWVAQDRAAQAEWQALVAREIGRLNRGGGALTQGTQAVGLLSRAERESFA